MLFNSKTFSSLSSSLSSSSYDLLNSKSSKMISKISPNVLVANNFSISASLSRNLTIVLYLFFNSTFKPSTASLIDTLLAFLYSNILSTVFKPIDLAGTLIILLKL